MSDALKSSRAKIRTFAHDLAAERKRREGPQSEEQAPKEQPSAAPLPMPEAGESNEEHQMGAVREHHLKKVTEVEDEPELKPEPKAKKEESPKQAPIVITEPKQKETPEIAEVPNKATSIPAFHELQRSVAESSGKKLNIGYDATVITDTKRKRFRLFPELVASVQKWFKGFSKKKDKPKHTYSVPETSHRKGVIQKATTKSGAIFSADSDTIKEHIRKRRQKDEEAAAQAPAVADEPETAWSPFTDSGYALIEEKGEETQKVADTTQNVSLEYKRVPDTPHVVAAPVAPPVPEVLPIVIDEVQEEVEDGEEVEQVEADQLAESRWSQSDETTESEPAPQPAEELPEAISDEAPEPPVAPRPTEQTENTGFLHQFDTNTITIVLVVMVVGFIAVALVSRVVINYLNKPEVQVQTLVEPTSSESILPGAQVLAFKITNETVDRLASEANEAVKETSVGLVELPVVSPIGEEISPSYFFELMRFRTSPPLRQAVTTARFVTVNQTAPSVILHFTDKETVRGEMLQWESTLVEDLATLYDLPKSELGSFEDSVIEGTDVRSISHGGKRVVIYGFIGTNTLLIANDAATFAQIQQLASDR